MQWQGLMPAITTEFGPDGAIDHGFVREHVRWLADHGASAIIPCGSLGEGATLEESEKVALVRTCVEALATRRGPAVPVVPGIAALSTRAAVRLCQAVRDAGAGGLMVLPPYVHKGPWLEIEAHFEAMLRATELECMLYNNPPAYGTDALPAAIVRLAGRHANLKAVKESSGDVRRITALKALAGARLALFVGLDDLVVEGVAAGAVGWVAGLVNALPAESRALLEHARAGRAQAAAELYRWFLPLLRLDALPEFVQLIKLAQVHFGRGSERLRAPRAAADGALREAALAALRTAADSRPASL